MVSQGLYICVNNLVAKKDDKCGLEKLSMSRENLQTPVDPGLGNNHNKER